MNSLIGGPRNLDRSSARHSSRVFRGSNPLKRSGLDSYIAIAELIRGIGEIRGQYVQVVDRGAGESSQLTTDATDHTDEKRPHVRVDRIRVIGGIRGKPARGVEELTAVGRSGFNLGSSLDRLLCKIWKPVSWRSGQRSFNR